MDQRKTDEFTRHQKARNIIEENRIRVALQSELVGNGELLDREYRDQINCVLGDQFGSIEEKMQAINAQQALVDNNEEKLLRQMELDTSKEIQAFKEEEERQKIRDERKLVDEIYKQYLVQKHPQYPKAKEKIAMEEARPAFNPKQQYAAIP